MHNRKEHRLQTLNITPTNKFQRLVLPVALAVAATTSVPAFAAPIAPSTPNMTDASDSGVFMFDNVTKVTQPIFIGTGQPYSVVTLFAGTKQVGAGVVLPSGVWTVGTNVKLSDGTYAVTVKQTTAGMASAASGALKVVIDTKAPAIPSVPDMVADSDHGDSNNDNLTNTTTPTFAGTGSGGDYISLYNNPASNVASIGSIVIPASGKWQYAPTIALPTGTHSYVISAQSWDVAGNSSARSGGLTVNIDTDKPAAATIPDLITTDDTGKSSTDNVTKVTTPTFTIKTEPGGKVEFYAINSKVQPIGSVNANNSGLAILKVTKPLDGPYSLDAINYDRAGNRAENHAPTLALNIDTKAPTVPGTPMLDGNSNSGLGNDHITNFKNAGMRGFCQPKDDGDNLDIAFAAGSSVYHAPTTIKFGAWWVTSPTLPEGIYEVTATDTDAAGNSSTSEAYELTIDTTPPPVPSVPDLTHFADTGFSDSDNKTNQTNLEFEGTSKGATTITLYNDGTKIASREAGVLDWLVKAQITKAGPFHISATATDVAGNVSAPSAELTGLLDLTAPSSTLTTPSATVVKNLNSLSGTAQDSTVNGDSSGMDKVAVGIRRFSSVSSGAFWSGTSWIDDNNELASTLVNGKWSKTTGLPTVGTNPATQVQDGLYWILMIAYDKAGNGTQSTFAVKVDNTVPYVAIVSPITNSVSQALAAIYGVASDETGVSGVKVSLQRKRNNVTYYWNGNAFTTNPATINANITAQGNTYLNWDCTGKLPKAADLDAGQYTVYASAYDAVGNTQTSSGRSFALSGSNVSPGTRPSGSAGTS
ncbi:hypothetical protein EON83_23260 [bacterium]|nr:MAG: hypothetical protein EON83_23260 [bacterium]